MGGGGYGYIFIIFYKYIRLKVEIPGRTSDLYYSLCDVKSTFYYKPFKTLLRNFMKQREFILQVLSP